MKRKSPWWFVLLCVVGLASIAACQPPANQESVASDGGETRTEGPRPETTKEPAAEGSLPEKTVEATPEVTVDGAKKDVPLLDHTKWVPTPPEQDMFRQKWPTLGAERCQGDFAWHLDQDALELDTEICNFITLEQPMLASIKKGDTLKLGLWHVQLYSDNDTEAVVTMYGGDTEIWTKTIAIPARANYYEPSFAATADIPKGSKLSFHLHNHGLNSWYLLYLVVSH
ncbi:MAG: hypothetical protein H6728_12085 [Myxococcales bacterium]|nr:hypothetical protein [Myxococcales bacterium]